MYLYNKTENYFEVYNMEEDSKLAREFRYKEVLNIPYYERVLYTIEGNLFDYAKSGVNEEKINDILKDYYRGFYNDCLVKMEGGKYLLYIDSNKVINLTKLLYGYHKILRGDFEVITEYSLEEIEKLLNLFKIRKIREVLLTDFYHRDSDFIKKTYEVVAKKSLKDEVGLRLFREYKK